MEKLTKKIIEKYNVRVLIVIGKQYTFCDATRFYRIYGFLSDIQAVAKYCGLKQVGCDSTLYYRN